MVENEFKRHTAKKFWIADLLKADVTSSEEKKQIIKIKEEEITRVNIIANIIFKFENQEKTYSSLTVEDSSETIRLKGWNESVELFNDCNIGDAILIIGRIRSYNDEIYIIPEIIKKLEDLNQEILRKLELFKMYGRPEIYQKNLLQKPIQEKKSSESLTERRVKLLNLLSTKSGEDGILISTLMEISGISEDDCDSLLNDMIRELLLKTEGKGALGLMWFIFSNNISSAFFAIFLGFFIGLFPIINSLINGLVLGYVLALTWQASGILSFWRLLPHGIFELPAIFISIGLGIKFGTFIFAKQKKEEFIYRFYNSLKVFFMVVLPLLVIAAIIEGLLIHFLS